MSSTEFGGAASFFGHLGVAIALGFASITKLIYYSSFRPWSSLWYC